MSRSSWASTRMSTLARFGSAFTCATSAAPRAVVTNVGSRATTLGGRAFYEGTVDQIVNVFEDSGRSVPVFNDKHLSWNWDWAKEMYDTSRSMGFPLMAGSSLPVTWRTPSSADS